MQMNSMEQGQESNNLIMTTDQDFEIPEDCHVGNYDPNRVTKHHNEFHARPLRSLFKLKYFKYTLFGQTWKPIATFVGLFYLVLVIYYQLPYKATSDCEAPTMNSFKKLMCRAKFSQYGFGKLVKTWKDFHKNLVKVLGLLLGFYVATLMARWWKQITHLPRIEELAMALNGIIQPGDKGTHAALEFKKRLLRHALLSYTLMMITISPSMRKMYGNGDKIVEKGIATWDGAIKRLRKEQGSKLGWMDKWWLPINWCCHLVREESSGSKGHIPRESKEVLGRLIKFKDACAEVAEYTHNPLPAICSQAVYFVCWTFLILGACAHQPCNGGDTRSSWWILEDVPIYPTLLFGLIFAWLKMGEICKSPFDGDVLYDIDLVDELDMLIWSASASLESIKNH